MKLSPNMLGGLAGAIALNLVHEYARKRFKDAPAVNRIAEGGIAKVANTFGQPSPTPEVKYGMAMTGDLVANTFYYSTIAKEEGGNIWLRGLCIGLIGGLGALFLPKQVGLDDTPVTRTPLTKVLTVAWYTIGGVVAAATVQALRRQQQQG
ncbi:hypothetical protein [Sphingobacterium allocomposti]|nr:hypothetical protein [Sphingobacterium composti Yoo et al. 2007 non Ten et al. 2007]HLS95193.1 hypothetical protein [Sphingobacterium sp.]